jgi:hypothetical protein
MKQELLKDKSGTISFTPYINNRAAVATSATVVLLNPDGTTLQASASATVNGTTGEISYTLTSGLTDDLGENYQAQWTYVISGTTYYENTLFDVVRNTLAITVIDEDLVREQREILDKNESFAGTVDSSTGTTLVDTDLARYDDDYWNNGIVRAVNPSDGVEQIRRVTDFVSSTGTLTVANSWGTNPTSSYTYIVYAGFAKIIEDAFDEMVLELRSKGNRPALIINSADLHIPHTALCLQKICADYMKEPGDKWDVLREHYEKRYKHFMDVMPIQYDRDESGYIQGTREKDRKVTQLKMVR